MGKFCHLRGQTMYKTDSLNDVIQGVGELGTEGGSLQHCRAKKASSKQS